MLGRALSAAETRVVSAVTFTALARVGMSASVVVTLLASAVTSLLRARVASCSFTYVVLALSVTSSERATSALAAAGSGRTSLRGTGFVALMVVSLPSKSWSRRKTSVYS